LLLTPKHDVFSTSVMLAAHLNIPRVMRQPPIGVLHRRIPGQHRVEDEQARRHFFDWSASFSKATTVSPFINDGYNDE
jgi:hypothetical protein